MTQVEALQFAIDELKDDALASEEQELAVAQLKKIKTAIEKRNNRYKKPKKESWGLIS